MKKLKLCPFCGSLTELVGECDMIWARCSNDDCQATRICKFEEPEDAIDDWNKRITPHYKTKEKDNMAEITLTMKCPSCGKCFYWFDYDAWQQHCSSCEKGASE